MFTSGNFCSDRKAVDYAHFSCPLRHRIRHHIELNFDFIDTVPIALETRIRKRMLWVSNSLTAAITSLLGVMVLANSALLKWSPAHFQPFQ